MTHSSRPAMRAMLAVVTINTAFWLMLYELGLAGVGENEGFENAQAVCLFLAGLTFAVVAYGGTGYPERLVLFGLCLLCWSCLLRELELDDLDGPAYLTALGTTRGRLAMLGPFWLLALGLALARLPQTVQALRRFRISHAGQIFGLGVLFYLLSWPFDQGKLSLTYQQAVFIEELLDLVACSCIFASGALLVVLARQGEVKKAALSVS